MDGWYVRQLLLNKDSIRSNIVFESSDIVDVNFDDPTYEDLLVVESKLEELSNNNILTDKEIVITTLLIEGVKPSTVAKNLQITQETILQMFSKVCSKIAFSLGGYFTNEGFAQKMTNKYKLNKQQIEKLLKLMEK